MLDSISKSPVKKQTLLRMHSCSPVPPNEQPGKSQGRDISRIIRNRVPLIAAEPALNFADSTGFYVLKAFPNESIDGFAWGNGPFLALHHWEAAFGLASTYYLSSKNTAPTAHRIR